MPLPVEIIRLRQGRHLLWLLRNQSLCHCTPLVKPLGYAPCRYQLVLSTSARAGTRSGCSPTYTLTAALQPLRRQAVGTLPLPVEIIRLRQGRHLLWLLTNLSSFRCTPPLKR